jgi:hypothetical protein
MHAVNLHFKDHDQFFLTHPLDKRIRRHMQGTTVQGTVVLMG